MLERSLEVTPRIAEAYRAEPTRLPGMGAITNGPRSGSQRGWRGMALGWKGRHERWACPLVEHHSFLITTISSVEELPATTISAGLLSSRIPTARSLEKNSAISTSLRSPGSL